MSQKIPIPEKGILEKNFEKMSLRELGHVYNTSPVTIRKWLKIYGLLENPKIFDINKIFYSKNGESISTRFNEEYIKKIGFYDKYNELTKNFSNEYTVREKIQAIKCGLIEPLKCIVCGNNTHYKEGRFSQYCSNYCSLHSSERARKISEFMSKTNHNKSNKKRKETMLATYGYETNSLRPECKYSLEKSILSESVLKKLKNKDWMEEEYIKKERNSVDIGIELGVGSDTVRYHLKKHNFDIRGNSNYSKYEVELRNLITDLGLNFIANNKNIIGMELDIYIPDKNVAIEFNGLWWHCDIFKNNRYHLEKTRRCYKKGIELIHIFEDDWIQKKEQFIDFIKSKLGIFDRRIPARKCSFRQLKNPVYGFFNSNHMQGRPHHSKYSFGLFYENELVGCVSYGKHHRGQDVLVLNRLAFKKGIQIIGGASKIVKNSLKILNVPVVSWSDNKWTNGNIYKNIGFTYSKEYRPDYSYFDKHTLMRFPKQSMQKSHINCPPNMTENEYCLSLGLYRIWDCGKKKWIWNP